jgi:hypothetical protein
LQNGADVLKSPDSNISDDVFRWSSPKIRLSNRPANINKKETIDTLSAIIQEYVDVRKTEGSAAAKDVISNRIAKVPTVLKYWEDDNELLGDKLVDTITVEDLNRLARAAKARGGKVGIITELDASGNPVPDSKGFNI